MAQKDRGKNTWPDVTTAEALDALRFPVILGIILIHCSYFTMQDTTTWPALASLVHKFITQLVMPALVPVFFFISGYFFFYKVRTFDWPCYKGKMARRFWSLVVPYVAWTALFICIMSVRPLYAHYVNGTVDLHSIHDMLTLKAFWSYPPDGAPLHKPLWYVRNLIVVATTTPLLHFILRKVPCIWFATLIGVFVWHPLSGFLTSFVIAYLHFSMGAYVSMKDWDFKQMLYKQRYLTAVAALVVAPLALLDYVPHEVFHLVSVFGIMTVLFCLHKHKLCHYPQLLTSSVTFVYFIHSIYIVKYTEMAVGLLLPTTNAYLIILRAMLLPMPIYLICTGIFQLLCRWMPKVANLLTGNRAGR